MHRGIICDKIKQINDRSFEMNLNVYADPSFRKTLWFMHILRGIAEEAERRHYYNTKRDVFQR